MFGFDDTSCDSSDALCKTVFSWTDNQKLANVSDIVIGKPLALLWLLVLFLVVRWILHRLIDKLVSKIKEGGLTLVPLDLYFKDGKVKATLALAKGKKSYDKRHDLAERDSRREIQKAFGRYVKGRR